MISFSGSPVHRRASFTFAFQQPARVFLIPFLEKSKDD